jgi:hypothetical protein
MMIPYPWRRSTSGTPAGIARDPALLAAACAALALGVAAAWTYHRAGLTLSHYDARAHLVVARRVIDNLTPGWRQLGAVWLPLPHLLNLVPVQFDVLYRTGLEAVAVSVACFGLAACAVARGLLGATGSRLAAASGAAVLALNPDLLYLQSTPMTEPLLLATMLLGVVLTREWVHAIDEPSSERRLRRAGWALVLACLTRYEAWPITAAVVVTAAVALWRRSGSARRAAVDTARLAVYPAATVAAFFVQSWLSIGRWFVTGGFYVPDNRDMGHPLGAALSVWWGIHQVTGYGVLLVAVAGLAAGAIVGLRRSSRAAMLVLLAPAAGALLPWYAFVEGHPFRIRYMVALVPAVALGAGLAVGLARRSGVLRLLVAAALVAVVAVETRPFSRTAPMVLEAQLDSANSAGRRVVSVALSSRYDGELVMASMGSLAHYMQQLADYGFDLRDFLHEGNGAIWQAALADPRPHVGWILVEEVARGGDLLAARARRTPSFLEGFERVAEGGGVALYRRLRAQGSGLRTQGSGLRAQDPGLRAQGSGLKP